MRSNRLVLPNLVLSISAFGYGLRPYLVSLNLFYVGRELEQGTMPHYFFVFLYGLHDLFKWTGCAPEH